MTTLFSFVFSITNTSFSLLRIVRLKYWFILSKQNLLPSCTFRPLGQMPGTMGTRRPNRQFLHWALAGNKWQTSCRSQDEEKRRHLHIVEPRPQKQSPRAKSIIQVKSFVSILLKFKIDCYDQNRSAENLMLQTIEYF